MVCNDSENKEITFLDVDSLKTSTLVSGTEFNKRIKKLLIM